MGSADGRARHRTRHEDPTGSAHLDAYRFARELDEVERQLAQLPRGSEEWCAAERRAMVLRAQLRRLEAR